MDKTTFFDYKPKILNDDLTENLEDYVYKRSSLTEEFQEEPREGDAENSKILLDLDKELEKNISTAKNVLFGDVFVRNYNIDTDEKEDDSFNDYFESRSVPEIKVVDVDSNDQFVLGHSGNVKFDDLLIDIDDISTQTYETSNEFTKDSFVQNESTSRKEKAEDILLPELSRVNNESKKQDIVENNTSLFNEFGESDDLKGFNERPEPDFAGFFEKEQKLTDFDEQSFNDDFFSGSSNNQSKYSEEKFDFSSNYENNPFRVNSTKTARQNEELGESRSLEILDEHSVDEDKISFNEQLNNNEQVQVESEKCTNDFASNTNPFTNYRNSKNLFRENSEDNSNSGYNSKKALFKENISVQDNNRASDVFDDLLERTRNSIKLIENPSKFESSEKFTEDSMIFPHSDPTKTSDIPINDKNEKFTTEIKFHMSAPSEEKLENKSQLLTGDMKENDLFDFEAENINKITQIEDKEAITRTYEFQDDRKPYLQRSLRSAMLQNNNQIDDEVEYYENVNSDKKPPLNLNFNTDQLQKGISALFSIKGENKTPSPTSPLIENHEPSPLFSTSPFQSTTDNDNHKNNDMSLLINHQQQQEQQSIIIKGEGEEHEEENDGNIDVQSEEIAPPLPLSEPPDRKTAPTLEISDHIADFEMDPLTGLRRIDLQDDPIAKAQMFVEGALSPSYKIRKRSSDKPSDENIEFQRQRESIMDEMRVRKKIFYTDFLKDDMEDDVFDEKVKESERKYWQKKKDDEGKKKNSLSNIFRPINSSTGKNINYSNFFFKIYFIYKIIA